MIDSLFLRWHLGLGDSLICHGLVRALRDRFGAVTVPCKFHNLPSVCWQFRDDPNIRVVPASDDTADQLYHNWHEDRLGLGYYGKDFDLARWDVSFYEQAGVDPDERWNLFHVERPEQSGQVIGQYAFVHRDFQRGLTFRPDTRLVCVEPSWFPTIFAWWDVIGQATELHCLDSSFQLLADLIPTHAEKYIVYRRPARLSASGPPTRLRKPWETKECDL